MDKERELVSFVAFSGVDWPVSSRPYLMHLLKEITEREKAKFVSGIGGIIAGQSVEKELRGRVVFERKQFVADGGKSQEFDADEVRREFVRQAAQEFSSFLPRLEGVSYHFVVAERVFDGRIGVEILKAVKGIRSDIRLLGEREFGEEFDPEPKIPIRTAGFEEARAIVPRKKPWSYRILTSFMQTLIDRFVRRTSSPPPNLILVGCTGTQAFLPFFKGVPGISLPALRKLEEVTSTENMVGVVVIKLVACDDRIKLVQRTYNLKPIIAREREFVASSEGSNRLERLVLHALTNSPASLNTIHFRVNEILKKTRNGRRKPFSQDEVHQALTALQGHGVVVYRENSNWYSIDDRKRSDIQVSLETIMKGTRVVKHLILSCVHTGALKSLYRTFRTYVPKRAAGCDAIFEVGDPTQDSAHNMEYAGEILLSMLSPDKQEIMAGALRAEIRLTVFRDRLAGFSNTKLSFQELLTRCLIPYVFTPGNHPSWKKHRKGMLVLKDFETELKQRLVDGIITILTEAGREPNYSVVKRVVDETTIRVGESGIVTIGGVTVGVKHPSKARTESKSHRIQDVVEFFWRTFRDFSKRVAKQVNGDFALVYLANFHEKAAVFVSLFGKVILGVMNGAYLKDTEFETSKDKVVDYGFTIVTSCINPAGELVYADVEFDNFMTPEDAKFVFANYPGNRIPTSAVLALEQELNQVVDIPWR